MGVAESRMTFFRSPSRPRPPFNWMIVSRARYRFDLSLRKLWLSSIRMTSKSANGWGSNFARPNSSLPTIVAAMVADSELLLPHRPERRRADDQRLLPAVIGEVLEQLLADPGLAQSHRVGDQHAVVAGEDAAGLLDRILLELGQVDGAAAELGSVLARTHP